MHTIKTAGVAILLATASLASEAAVSEQEVAELRQQVQALMARVEQLEARNQQLAAGAAPAGRMEELEVRVAEVEATNEAQTDRLAQAAASAKAADWAGRIKLKGDLRYRHDMIEEEGLDDRTRQRIRARFGMDAKVNDTLTAGFQLATGAGADPRSSNVTLGDSNQRKEIRLDLAYVDWRAFDGGVVTAGKQKQPWFKPGGSAIYDSDVNPEGVALRWSGAAGAFANAWGYWLSESGTGADANLFGAQLGWKSGFGLTVAASYHDYGAIQGSTLSFTDFPAGNSTYVGDRNCNLPAVAPTVTCYVYDYNIVALSAEYDAAIGSLPVQLWAEFIENQDPSDLNQGYSLGTRLGRAADVGSWEVSLLYQEVERDAQWGGLLESDFAGGSTQGKGFMLKAGWVPVRNVTLNLTLMDTTRDFDQPTERDYDRLLFDVNFKF